MAARARPSTEVSIAFGGPVTLRAGDAADLSSALTPEEDMELVRRALLGFNEGGAGFLRFCRPRPTAAFSPRDTTLPRYAEAAQAMRARGFAPVERRAGGSLAVYDENALVIDLVAPHPDPREHVIERFRLFSQAIASALVKLGADARAGAVPGEYCPGDYSVNAGGKIKLAGLAQRIGRNGYHVGAVISVLPSEAAKAAVEEAYLVLGMKFTIETFGALADLAPISTFGVLAGTLFDMLRKHIEVARPTGVEPVFTT